MREFERNQVDVVFFVRIMQHAVELDLLNLGDGADVARNECLYFNILFTQ